MNRFRLLVAAVLLLLWVPVGLLVRHALDNVESERLERHRAVAERFFDEMERELTEWLRSEEERPFGHYRFLYLPRAEASPRRSPLADGPEVPFVYAYFQIDPSGEVSSPLWPQDADRADRLLGWRMDEKQEQRRDEILGVLAQIVSAPAERPDPRSPSEALARLRGENSLLSRLNRGLKSRSERTTQVQQSQAANVALFAEGEKSRRRKESAPPAEARAEDPLSVVDVSLEPMVGRAVDGPFTLLYRTVVIGDRAYRQGMVLDGRALVEWLEDRVLQTTPSGSSRHGAASLPRNEREGEPLSVEWRDPGLSPDPPASELVFTHRFAEPFKSTGARARLDPLPESVTSLYIYFLALLLALTSTLGVWALFRTVAARLRFAERQSNFVSAVTHELKTPLTAIRMHGEMLRDGMVPSEDKRRGYYRVLTSEAERLTRLIDNVLELSQIEKQTRRFDLRPGDARRVAAEVVEVLGPHAERRGFVLALEDDGPADAIYDADALAQVLFNLVDNALKYAQGADEKTVWVQTRNRDDQVAITVADRGPGVPRKQLREVFEPFFRGENEMTRTTKGTGIGLALVRGLVEPMGGEVRGRNRGGGGFAVEVRLPAASS